MGNETPDRTPGDDLPPRRVQLSRAKGWKMPPNTVKVDRTTEWGNPVRPGDTHCANGFPYHGGTLTVREAVSFFRAIIGDRLNRTPDCLEPLRGKNLACWCKLDEPCHADVLLELSNRDPA